MVSELAIFVAASTCARILADWEADLQQLPLQLTIASSGFA